jgi:hypothetical protein
VRKQAEASFEVSEVEKFASHPQIETIGAENLSALNKIMNLAETIKCSVCF